MSRWIPSTHEYEKMESIYSSSTHFTRVDGTIRLYRYFSNHDDKVVTLGPREVEFGTVKQPGGRSVCWLFIF